MKQDKMDNDEFFKKLQDLHTLAEIEKLLEQAPALSSEYTNSTIAETAAESDEDGQETEV